MSREIKIDVVDLYGRLKKDYPHVEFKIEDEVKKFGSSLHTFHRFKIVKLFNYEFEKPLKTTISMLQNSYMTEFEYYKLNHKMWESFGQHKLLGLI
jgi:hypothetical protein